MTTDENKIKEAMDVLRCAMQMEGSEPGSYAHGWHCNIAMVCHDAIRNELYTVSPETALKIGNKAATQFMKNCFGVETSQ